MHGTYEFSKDEVDYLNLATINQIEAVEASMVELEETYKLKAEAIRELQLELNQIKLHKDRLTAEKRQGELMYIRLERMLDQL